MIFVPVGEYEADNVAVQGVEHREIRVDDIDPKVAVVEGNTAIHKQNLASLLEGEAIHANLAKTAERKDAQHGTSAFWV
jgi:hypothetical protein